MLDAPSLIRRHRLAARLSQRELARRAGTSAATLNRYESGRVDPTVSTLNRILHASLPPRRRWASVAELAPAIAGELKRGSATAAWRHTAGEFLDDHLRASAADVSLAVADAPAATGDARADALAAALAEYVCALHGMPPPPWAQAPIEVTPWWFVAGAAFHALALRESPPSFARRGIFVTAGAVERV
ncbi:MAG TPA: helix-turn-helix transcriptional regulator [Candidatus Dormibacteraeota bacterium]|nr:helix-turn-helix transcriptional regulator [Candidatus Dormibacteraeota bacterium]